MKKIIAFILIGIIACIVICLLSKKNRQEKVLPEIHNYIPAKKLIKQFQNIEAGRQVNQNDLLLKNIKLNTAYKALKIEWGKERETVKRLQTQIISTAQRNFILNDTAAYLQQCDTVKTQALQLALASSRQDSMSLQVINNLHQQIALKNELIANDSAYQAHIKTLLLHATKQQAALENNIINAKRKQGKKRFINTIKTVSLNVLAFIIGKHSPR